MFDDGIFAQVVFDDFRDVGVDGFIVGDTGAEGVGEHDVAGAVGVEEAGGAERRIGPEGERVEKIVIHAAVNHIYALQAGGGPHEDEVVVDHQIAALDKFDTHLAGQVRVFEIGGVIDAGRQQNDG